ncbi:hypothetical protein D3C75_1169230 [compost metagenome]
MLWRAVLRQITGGGAQQVFDSHQLAANQAGRRALGNTQRQIDPIVNQVHIAIFQPQANVYLGITA